MRKRLIASIVVLAAALSLGLVAWAIEHDGWGPAFRGHESRQLAARLLAFLDDDHFRSELGLSDQQAEHLRQIVVDTEKSSIKTGADIAVRGVELRELLRADNPDHEAVMRKVQEISNLRGEMMKQHVGALLAAKTVLTPEQQKKIRAFLERRHVGGFWRERLREHPNVPGAPPEQPGRMPKPPAD